jgi:phage I-like protein
MPTATKPSLLRLAEFAGAVQLKEKDGKSTVKVQVMRTGAFEHPWYGTMLITPTVLSDMVKNFKDNVRRQDLPADFFHESDREAAGWFTDLYTEENGSQLWGDVQPTPKLLQMLADKEVRYFSADFYFEWTDPETNVSYKNVLNGGGFVNRPFIKGMQPVAELSEFNEGERMKTVEQLNQEIKSLSEKHEKEIATLSEQVKSKDGEIVALKGEVAVLKKDKEVAAKEAKFSELLAKGKACAAQKDAFMAGDMEKFLELAQPVNAGGGSGNGGEGGGNTTKLSEEEKAMCVKLGLTEEEYAKYNK